MKRAQKTFTAIAIYLLCGGLCISTYGQVILFDKTTHDFGTITEDGGAVEGTFLLTNKTGETLTPLAPDISCGCTLPVFNAKAWPHGEERPFNIKYDPNGRPGSFLKGIGLRFQELDSVYTINISGTVLPHPYPVVAAGLRWTSTTFDFGALWHHQRDTAWLKIKNENSSPYALALPEDLPAGFRLVQLPERIAPGQESKIGLLWEVPESGHWGFAFEHFVLSIGPEGGEREDLRINLTAMVREDFARTLPDGTAPAARLSESALELGAVSAGKTHSTYTQIENTGDHPLLIRAIKSSCSCLEVIPSAMEIAPGGSIPVELIYTPGAQVQGLQALSVQFTVNDPAQSQLRLTLKAQVSTADKSQP